MNLFVIGINHRTAELDVREKLWFSDNEIRAALPSLNDKFFSECFLLSTCNRTELYGVPDGKKSSPSALTDAVGRYLIDVKSTSAHVKSTHLYHLSGWSAAAHLFRVVSGIDYMRIADGPILDQGN